MTAILITLAVLTAAAILVAYREIRSHEAEVNNTIEKIRSQIQRNRFTAPTRDQLTNINTTKELDTLLRKINSNEAVETFWMNMVQWNAYDVNGDTFNFMGKTLKRNGIN